jgi:hypothetical protein
MALINKQYLITSNLSNWLETTASILNVLLHMFATKTSIGLNVPEVKPKGTTTDPNY